MLILDLGLPDIDGIKVLEKIRRFSSVPVLIVSARDTQDSIVKGLELGAEDYIVKPFEYRDLLVRLDNVIHPSRVTQPQGKEGVENEGRIVPLQRLAKEVWKGNSIDSSTMRSTVSRLRTKLGDDPHTPRIILSEHGAGYRFVRPD